MRGQITKIISDLHFVSYKDEEYACKCRGIFRKNRIIPLVGDYVLFDKDKLVIEEVLERKNSFDRPSVANIDQAILVMSVKSPDFSLNLLDKFISLMEINHVKPIICITKMDLLNDDEKNYINDIISYYKKIPYKVLYNTELEQIKEILKDKTSVFTGQTGAGKSTLLNKLSPELNLKTGEISKALGRGRHTTRVVELFSLFGGKVLDTPGFSSLELNKYSNDEIKESFIDFNKYPCIYNDCLHKNEGECNVKKAVYDNNIMKSRYENYIKFIERK